MAGVDFKRCRELVTLAQVLDLIEWAPNVTHGAYGLRGNCPIHGGDSPKSRIFAADTRLQRWYCHRCKAGGDWIDLYAALKGISVYRAAIEVCERLLGSVPWVSGGLHYGRPPRNRKRNGTPGWHSRPGRNGQGQ